MGALDVRRKPSMPDFVIQVLLLLDGLAIGLLAIFAHEIGLDPNPAWGFSRFFLLAAGLLLVSLCFVLIYFRSKTDNFFISRAYSDTAKILISVGHVWLVVFLLYVWFITYGNWTTWNHTTNYYEPQAEAFIHGKLNVDLDPGAALLASPDPYNPDTRPQFNSDIWDMSLYKGKAYLYWGPVPALLIVPIELLSPRKITDNYLVFFFFAALLVVNSLLIIKLRRMFFPSISGWNVMVCVFVAGLVLPVLWSVNGARVYEAAIAAGQFFLMGGIFFAFSAFGRDAQVDKVKLFLAGLFWAGSAGSRALNLFSILFCVGLVAVWLIRARGWGGWRQYLPELCALLFPLAFGGIALGWYNWARFDSPFEFGYRYQITIHDLNKQAYLTFQPDYFFLNIYNYVFQPFEPVASFPFLRPIVMTAKSLAGFHMTFPKIYFAGRMTGLLFCAPFLALSLAHLSRHATLAEENASGDRSAYHLVVYLLAGSFFCGFLSLMFFFFAQMRYLVDVISQITLLAIIGYWMMIANQQRLNVLRTRALVALAGFFVLVTVTASLLLAFSSDYDRLKTLNPGLFQEISNSLSIQR